MNRHVTMAAVATVVTLALSAPAQAQMGIFLGGGTSVAIGESRSLVKIGWMAIAGVSYSLPTGLFITGEFQYGENKLEIVDGKSKLVGGMANLGYRFGSQTGASIYAFGGVGGLNQKTGGPGVPSQLAVNETQFSYGGGVGLELPLSGVSLWFEGRLLRTSDIELLPFMAGVLIHL